jgi:hypothetical protein
MLVSMLFHHGLIPPLSHPPIGGFLIHRLAASEAFV